MKDNFNDLATEKINSRIKKKSDTNEHLIGDFIDEYNDVGLILKKNKKKISEAVNLFTKTFTKNGSIYFIGAGTSGRLGVLEAAECPPTFGTQPDRIVGLMAGGRSAVFKSKEGAEDSPTDSIRDLEAKNFNKNDLLIGISASGKSTYVLSAIKYAKGLKAKTILICCNKLKKSVSYLDIVLDVGPEFVAGSTRLKSGTLTKNTLNIITTISMIKLEKVYNNMMIDILPTTKKLKARCVRNLSNILSLNEKDSLKLLEKSKWNIRIAIIIYKMDISFSKAKALYKKVSIIEILDG